MILLRAAMPKTCSNTSIANLDRPEGPVVTAEEFLNGSREARGLTGEHLSAWCPLCSAPLVLANKHSYRTMELHFRHDHRLL